MSNCYTTAVKYLADLKGKIIDVVLNVIYGETCNRINLNIATENLSKAAYYGDIGAQQILQIYSKLNVRKNFIDELSSQRG